MHEETVEYVSVRMHRTTRDRMRRNIHELALESDERITIDMILNAAFDAYERERART